MSDSIFTKIIKGEIPSYKIYEDDLTFVFLDIHPKTPGHCLVIPKQQVEYIWDLPDKEYLSLMLTVKKTGGRIREVLQPKWVGMQVEGVAVPHAHVHVFPFNSIEEYRRVPDHSAEPNNDALAEIAEKLAF
jgi:histidine triad (HIT) family protein